MRTADLLAVMDREADLLAGVGQPAASAVMAEASELVRTMMFRLQLAGLSVEQTPVHYLHEPDPDGIRIAI